MFETLQGNPPFNGKDSVDILVKQITIDAPEMTLSGLAPVLQVKLNKIVAKCLAKDKENRYQSASELKEALGQVMAGNSVTESLKVDVPTEPVKADIWSGRREELLSWFNQRFKH